MIRRERITPHEGDSRHARRNEKGEFDEQDDVGKSLKQDRARRAENIVEPGQGDCGDRMRK